MKALPYVFSELDGCRPSHDVGEYTGEGSDDVTCRDDLKSIQSNLVVPVEKRAAVRELIESWDGQLTPRDDRHCRYSYELVAGAERLIVRQYSSGTLQVQGKGGHRGQALLRALAAAVLEDSLNLPLPHCGSDEVGKGDYFGPLVVVGVCVDETTLGSLASLGVTDSKRLADSRIKAIGEKLGDALSGKISVLCLKPVTYNDLYDRLRAEGKNLNDLLAWCHSKVLHHLEKSSPSAEVPVLAVVDKFAREGVLRGRMKDTSMKIMQVERGERYPAVAAASILARQRFLEEMDELSREIGMPLPKGAGSSVDAAARRIVKELGIETLKRVAKLHFANTGKISGG